MELYQYCSLRTKLIKNMDIFPKNIGNLRNSKFTNFLDMYPEYRYIMPRCMDLDALYESYLVSGAERFIVFLKFRKNIMHDAYEDIYEDNVFYGTFVDILRHVIRCDYSYENEDGIKLNCFYMIPLTVTNK